MLTSFNIYIIVFFDLYFHNVVNIGVRSMNITRDLGEVGTWDEAVEIALTAHSEGNVDFIATVSKQEFEGGKYVGTPLRDMGMPERQVIENVRGIGSILHPTTSKLRVLLKKVAGSHPSYLEKENLSILVIVHLEAGEEIKVEVK